MKSFVVVFFILLLAPAYGGILHKADMESGDLWKEFGWLDKCCDHSLNIVTSPVRAGKNAVRAEVRRYDPDVAGNKRVEMIPPMLESNPLSSAGGFGDTRWFGFSVFIPNDWVFDNPYNIESLFQVHSYMDTTSVCPSGENPGSPPFAIVMKEGMWRLNSRYDSTLCSTPSTIKDNWWDLGSVEKGKWTDFVINLKWSYQNDGYIKIWKNGVLVQSSTGPNFYNNRRGGFIKMGVYKWWWNLGSPYTTKAESRVLYYDEFRSGDANSSYSEVAPAGGSPVGTTPTPDPDPTPEPSPAPAPGTVIDSFTGVQAPTKVGCGYNETSAIYIQGCNGYVGKLVVIKTDGKYDITTRAAGRLWDANNVRMEIFVDGNLINGGPITSYMDNYTVSVDLKAGNHEIIAKFVNDADGRDMAVERMTVIYQGAMTTSAPAPAPAPAVVDSFTGAQAPTRVGCGSAESIIYIQACNGYIGKLVVIPKDGKHNITVRASGRLYDASNVRMEILVGGKVVLARTLSKKMNDYTVAVDLKAGNHEIVAKFVNDAKGRDMAVERFTVTNIGPMSSTTSPINFSYSFSGMETTTKTGCGYSLTSTQYVLSCNGSVSKVVSLPASTKYRITVSAKGWGNDGLGAILEIRVDGKTYRSVAVTGTLADYSVDVSLSEGSRKIEAAFTNDLQTRDLGIERISLVNVP